MTDKIAERHIEALERHVQAGHFGSIDQALDVAVDQLDGMFEGDCDWAVPLLAEADADIAAGRIEEWVDVRKAMFAAVNSTKPDR